MTSATRSPYRGAARRTRPEASASGAGLPGTTAPETEGSVADGRFTAGGTVDVMRCTRSIPLNMGPGPASTLVRAAAGLRSPDPCGYSSVRARMEPAPHPALPADTAPGNGATVRRSPARMGPWPWVCWFLVTFVFWNSCASHADSRRSDALLARGEFPRTPAFAI